MVRSDRNLSCSFCGRNKNEVERLVIGTGNSQSVTFICNYCIETCHKALQSNSSPEKKKFKLLTPQEIYGELSKFIEGQEHAKKVLATTSYNHYKRVFYNTKSDIQIQKTNILIIGPTGSGKTSIVQTLSEILDVPFACASATTFTAAGYVGYDVDHAVEILYKNSGSKVDKTQIGIIFFDEIDKTKKNNDERASPDVSGAGVQQDLLTMMEGREVEVPLHGKKGPNAETVTIKTHNILFIFAGAFSEMPNIVLRDLKKKNSILSNNSNSTFSMTSTYNPSDYDAIMSHLDQTHLEKYGMLPEFLGRLPIVLVLNQLKKEDLLRIMTKPQNAILKQYQELLRIKEGAKLEWTKQALLAIAEKALQSNRGARGLKSIIEQVLLEPMYRLPSLRDHGQATVLITEEAVQNKESAVISFEPAKSVKVN